MKNKVWISYIFLLILAGIAVGVRIYYINYLMAEVSISEDIYNAAKVKLNTNGFTAVFADGFHLQSLYVYSLYLAFLIFGNFTVAGIYLNILYQVLTVLLVYLAVSNLSNRYIGLAAGAILSILPIYIGKLAEVTMSNMEIFIISVICAIVTFIVRIVYNRHRNKKKAASDQLPVQENTVVITEAVLNAVQDTSMKEIVLDDLEDKKINYIENPLPVPKRREHKEMDFAFKPTGSAEDYDLKDMTGKDFYDIE